MEHIENFKSDTLKYAVLAKYFIPGMKIFYRNISMVSAWSQSGSIKRKFNSFLFKRVDFVTSVGQKSLNDLINAYRFPVERTKLIKRGIPKIEINKKSARTELSNLFGYNYADKVLVHVGNFSPEKNHPFLVEVFKKVVAKEPDTRLIFMGEGARLDMIKKSCQKLSYHVFFVGLNTNVQKFIAGCDVFILGSTVEGVPGVILEAAMQNVPSVAVNVGGVSEVVLDGITGLLVQEHNSTLFADAVLKLLENDVLIRRMGDNARNLIAENYSLISCANQFEELYNSVSKN